MKLTQEVIDQIQEAMLHTKMNGDVNWQDGDEIDVCLGGTFAGEVITCYCMVESFTRAMPDEYKHDTSIDTFTAYKNYIRSKPWVASNYLRDPSRKPNWI